MRHDRKAVAVEDAAGSLGERPPTADTGQRRGDRKEKDRRNLIDKRNQRVLLHRRIAFPIRGSTFGSSGWRAAGSAGRGPGAKMNRSPGYDQDQRIFLAFRGYDRVAYAQVHRWPLQRRA